MIVNLEYINRCPVMLPPLGVQVIYGDIKYANREAVSRKLVRRLSHKRAREWALYLAI